MVEFFNKEKKGKIEKINFAAKHSHSNLKLEDHQTKKTRKCSYSMCIF